MRVIDRQLVHTVSDLVWFLDCSHLVLLEREVAFRRRERLERTDLVPAKLRERGGAVETAYLESLEAGGKHVVLTSRPDQGRRALVQAAAHPAALLAEVVDVVAQAVLFDGTWLGYADVRERVSPPS
jgi:uncharacterized protein